MLNSVISTKLPDIFVKECTTYTCMNENKYKNIIDRKKINGINYVAFECPNSKCDDKGNCTCDPNCILSDNKCILKKNKNMNLIDRSKKICDDNCKNIDSSTGNLACPDAKCGDNGVCDCGTNCIYSSETNFPNTCYPYKIKYSDGKLDYFENKQQYLSALKYDPKSTVLFKPKDECHYLEFNKKSYCITDPNEHAKLNILKNKLMVVFNNFNSIVRNDIILYKNLIKDKINNIENISIKEINNNKNNPNICNTFEFNTKQYCIKDINLYNTLNNSKTEILNDIKNIKIKTNEIISDNINKYKKDYNDLNNELAKYTVQNNLFK